MKLEFNPQRIVKNPRKSFDIFSQNSTNNDMKSC